MNIDVKMHEGGNADESESEIEDEGEGVKD